MTESASAAEVLQTPRLRLRPMVASDAAALHSCYGDAEAMRFWDFSVSRDPAHTAERLADSLAVDPRWHRGWAVILKSSDAFIGYVNYHRRDPRHHRLEVGYILARRYWQQGLMSEAMHAFLEYCFGRLETHRVEAEIEPENVGSICLAQQLGFQREGVLRDRLFVDGRYRSLVMFSLLDTDWRASMS
jgi:[ribosomal protein S5]-alanine N-acetyltransferase